MKQIEFKKVGRNPESDESRLIWEWRNDPVTRQMSRQTGLINWEEHTKWVQEIANSEKNALFILMSGQVPLCMIRFSEMDGSRAEISINFNPVFRGKKLSKQMLIEACHYGFNTLSLQQLYAEIKPENSVSIKIFEGAGFIFQGERAGLRTYLLTN